VNVIPGPPLADAGSSLLDPVQGILRDLTPAQHRAVVSPASPLVVLAGAGAGKTRVLTRRIAHQVELGRAGADHVLALTFTRKAAGELSSRLQALGLRDHITAGTFHAVASAQLRRWWADQGRFAPTLLASPSRLLSALAGDTPAWSGIPIREVAAELAWAQARLIGPERFATAASASGRRLPADAGDLAVLYGRYEEEKRRRGLVDFDDLLARCADAMDDDARFAAAQRWRWRHVFVDEFQDVNPLQHRLLTSWLGSDADLTVVGDPNQAIYCWNGADPGLLDALPHRWPQAEVVRLDDNHRCSPQIVAAGTSVLGSSGDSLRSSRPDGPTPTVRSYASEDAEAAGVAGELHQAHAAGLPWSQMAVLVRTNAQGQPLRAALEAAGIPCAVPSQADVLRHPAAVEALDELRSRVALPVAVAAADLDAAALDAAGSEPAASAGREPGRGARGAEAAGVLALLADLARDLRRLDHRATIGAFLAWLPSAAGREPGSIGQIDAVTIASFHRAKGLEWRAVWVCGLEQGLVPIAHAATAEAQAEERRLLYVALTRAEADLHCSWAARRRFGDRSSARDPSPWLSAIGATTAPSDTEPDTRDWRSVLAEQRRRLREGRAPGDGGAPEPSEDQPAARPPAAPLSTVGQDQLRLDLDRANAAPGPVPDQADAGLRRFMDQTDAGPGPVADQADAGPGPVSDQAPVAARPVPDQQVLRRVQLWRAERARGVGIPAQALLQDRSVDALAELRPTAAADLAAIPGLGPVRAARFGAILLELVAGTVAAA
jgi:DNA helicase II / ATP-dependent DNA helicase PcrA